MKRTGFQPVEGYTTKPPRTGFSGEGTHGAGILWSHEFVCQGRRKREIEIKMKRRIRFGSFEDLRDMRIVVLVRAAERNVCTREREPARVGTFAKRSLIIFLCHRGGHMASEFVPCDDVQPPFEKHLPAGTIRIDRRRGFRWKSVDLSLAEIEDIALPPRPWTPGKIFSVPPGFLLNPIVKAFQTLPGPGGDTRCRARRRLCRGEEFLVGRQVSHHRHPGGHDGDVSVGPVAS